MTNQLKTSAEETAYEAVMAEHDLRKRVDRAAGLNNDLKTAASRWREFLESRHEEIYQRWPEIRDAVVDARRWENPVHFNGTFAEKVARALPLPAISSVGQMERIICRALVMLAMPEAEREELIKAAYAAEKEAHAETARLHKLKTADLDLSAIKFDL